MSLWLTEDELYELTGYRQRKKQLPVLAGMKWLDYRVRDEDGFPLVPRYQFVGGATGVKRRRVEPNFGGAHG